MTFFIISINLSLSFFFFFYKKMILLTSVLARSYPLLKYYSTNIFRKSRVWNNLFLLNPWWLHWWSFSLLSKYIFTLKFPLSCSQTHQVCFVAYMFSASLKSRIKIAWFLFVYSITRSCFVVIGSCSAIPSAGFLNLRM